MINNVEKDEESKTTKKSQKSKLWKILTDKLTTTKVLLYFVLLVWVLSLIFCDAMWVIKGEFPSECMESVNVVALPTILSYTVKSGFEFATRAKSGTVFSTDQTNAVQ